MRLLALVWALRLAHQTQGLAADARQPTVVQAGAPQIPTVVHEKPHAAPPAPTQAAPAAGPAVAPAAGEPMEGVPQPYNEAVIVVAESAGASPEVVHVIEEPAADMFAEALRSEHLGRIILIVALVALAVELLRLLIYWKFLYGRRRTEGMALPAPGTHHLRPSTERSPGGVDVLVCFSGKCLPSCCEVVCFPDLLWAELVSDKLRWVSFPVAWLFTCLFCLCKDIGALCFCCTRFYTRHKIRTQFERRPPSCMDNCADCTVHCAPNLWGAAVYQELEFVEVYGK